MTLNVTEIAERADALYAARQEREAVEASVELLEAALEEEFAYELGWRQGRALFFLGQETVGQATTRLLHKRGVRVCLRAARERPQRVEGHFWLGVNRALLAALEPPLRALPRALLARRSLRRAAEIDAAYHATGPLRVLARLEARLPRLFGGGARSARAHFEQALQIAPANTVTRLYFAELLLASGDHARTRQQLDLLLATPPDPAWAFETARDHRIAQALLDKISPKSKPMS